MYVQILNSHPHIVCHGELLRKKNVGMRGALKVLKYIDKRFLSEQHRQENPYELVESIFQLAGEEIRSVGFKLMLGQHRLFRDQLIADPAFLKILLHRHNILAVYSSDKIAKITGQGVVGRFKKVKKAKAKFDEKEFMKFWRRRLKQYALVQELAIRFSQPLLEVEYLSLVKGDGVDATVRFLGQDPSIGELKAHTKKRNPSSILDRFTNPKAVEKFIEKNDLEHWRYEKLPDSQSN
jgi:hypothetical protein